MLRARLGYFIMVIVVIVLGLSSRAFADELPAFIADHFGDALWAGMIYFAIRIVFINRTLGMAAGLGVMLCFGIEFSQLYQADWINDIRATTLGALILGKGYLTMDLIRYSVGILVSCLVDRYGFLPLHKKWAAQ
ncbi:DUF2809 domain-containing protein [Paenibacillus oenotherae]|uniref:DUF2809 domain-containing protein n=1 Tax=Paenibacillus oenotherae TaxID=1435645 RepID=A0ABS7D8A4_9BACL|nr:DUF2809 domain-containing protein [Paenibacillus oenotherae]MBW7476164.1 DUF2809 domain-containing protein [Paenibacillus oenotherae]